jgi:AcrR family transcriptional regulator
VAEDGANDLSLRAVARDVGMVSSAVYRYFSSRDELLTALIIEAYDSLGEHTEAASRPPAADPQPHDGSTPHWRSGRGRWHTATTTR